MSAFLFAQRFYAVDYPPYMSEAEHSTRLLRPGWVRGHRGPIQLGEAMAYIAHEGSLRFPLQLHFKNCKDMGLDLLWALDNLKRVDHNREVPDNGVLLQFGSVQHAIMYKLKWS